MEGRGGFGLSLMGFRVRGFPGIGASVSGFALRLLGRFRATGLPLEF